MTSNDTKNFVTVELFNSETNEIKYQIRSGFEQNSKEFRELRNETQAVKDIALINSSKIDAYRDFTGLCFTVLAIIVALVGFVITLTPMFRDMYHETKSAKNQDALTEKKVQDMIDRSIAKVLSQLNLKGDFRHD